ncbi:MAG: hypothetical protein KDK00_09165 [Rhodobacteraceae bacterium]|nr:hypothetical protein [Paracoccaceae bacterium]
MKSFLTCTALAFCIGATAPVQAQTFGYAGIGYGVQRGANPDNGAPETHGFGQIDGAFGFGGTRAVSFIIEASTRTDAYTTSLITGTPSTGETNLAGHVWYDPGGRTRVGAFAGYAFATNPNPNERQTLAYLGVQAIQDLGRDLLVFGQLGTGTSGPVGTKNSYGFYNGVFGRVGIAWGGLANTSLRAEFELAASPRYEAASEPGMFRSLMIGGETAFGGGNWAATYGVRTALYDALDDPDKLEETTITAGIRYTFGNKGAQERLRAGMIGTPLLPVRATTVTPMMD